jgi:hypothetical protein
MSITEIAAYLRDRSAWGWKKRRELNFRTFVQDAVPDELRRAARSGEVRFIGTNPNSAEAHEISRGYWDAATLIVVAYGIKATSFLQRRMAMQLYLAHRLAVRDYIISVLAGLLGTM